MDDAMNETARTVIRSSNRGRFATLQPDGDEGGDLTSGQPLDLWDGQQWRAGRIEHNGDGYYFTDGQGFTEMLREGLRVQVRH